MLTLPLVYIEWVDSSSTDTWMPPEVVVSEGPLTLQSIGWLLHRDDEQVVIAASLGSNGEVCMTLSIPTPAVLKLEFVENAPDAEVPDPEAP